MVEVGRYGGEICERNVRMREEGGEDETEEACAGAELEGAEASTCCCCCCLIKQLWRVWRVQEEGCEVGQALR